MTDDTGRTRKRNSAGRGDVQVETFTFGDLVFARELKWKRRAPDGCRRLMAEVVTEVKSRRVDPCSGDAVTALSLVRIPDLLVGIGGCRSNAHAMKRSL